VGINIVDAEGKPVAGQAGIEEEVSCRIFTAPEVDLMVGQISIPATPSTALMTLFYQVYVIRLLVKH